MSHRKNWVSSNMMSQPQSSKDPKEKCPQKAVSGTFAQHPGIRNTVVRCCIALCCVRNVDHAILATIPTGRPISFFEFGLDVWCCVSSRAHDESSLGLGMLESWILGIGVISFLTSFQDLSPLSFHPLSFHPPSLHHLSLHPLSFWIRSLVMSSKNHSTVLVC